jgi:hypothetical protein
MVFTRIQESRESKLMCAVRAALLRSAEGAGGGEIKRTR